MKRNTRNEFLYISQIPFGFGIRFYTLFSLASITIGIVDLGHVDNAFVGI
jgi:hypothetical protein